MFQSGQNNVNNGSVAPAGALQGNALVNTTTLDQRLNAWVQTQGDSQDAHTARTEFQRVAQHITRTTLNLYDLQLSQLPDVFALLPHLTEVNLSGNKVLDTTLPASLQAHANVRILNLQDTPFDTEHVDTLRRNNSNKNCAIHTNKQPTTFAALPAELKQAILLKSVQGMQAKDTFDRLVQLRTVNRDVDANLQDLMQLPDLAHMRRERTKEKIKALAYQKLPLDEYKSRLQGILSNNRDVGLIILVFPPAYRETTLAVLAAKTDLHSLNLIADRMLDIKQAVLTRLNTILANNTGLTEVRLTLKECGLTQEEVTTLVKQKRLQATLRYLDLGNNSLTELPPEIGNLKQLQELRVWSNKLTALPPEIGNLKQLQMLWLGSNNLTELPPEIGNLKQLQRLELYGNQLTVLLPEIRNLTKLWDLGIDNNKLTALPPEIWNLTKLRHLDLGRNQLTALPSEIGNLKQLQSLKLWYNNLTALPPQIGNLKQLLMLEIRSNKLTALPPEIGNLKQLRTILFKGNNLSDQAVILLQDLKAAAQIRVDYDPDEAQKNRVEEATAQRLTLVLNTVDACGYDDATREALHEKLAASLTTRDSALDLSNLQLTQLPDVFEHLWWVKKVDLSNNQFSTADALQVLANGDDPRELTLLGNPLPPEVIAQLDPSKHSKPAQAAPVDQGIAQADEDRALPSPSSEKQETLVREGTVNSAKTLADSLRDEAGPGALFTPDDAAYITKLKANPGLLDQLQQLAGIDLASLQQQPTSSSNADAQTAEQWKIIANAANTLQSIAPDELKKLKDIATAFSGVQIEDVKQQNLRQQERLKLEERLAESHNKSGSKHDIINQGTQLYDDLFMVWINLPTIMTQSRIGMIGQGDLSRRGKQVDLAAGAFHLIPVLGNAVASMLKKAIATTDKNAMATHVLENLQKMATPSALERTSNEAQLLPSARMQTIAHALALRMALHFSDKLFEEENEEKGMVGKAKQKGKEKLQKHVTGTRAEQNLANYFERILDTLNKNELEPHVNLFDLDSSIDSLVTAALLPAASAGNKAVAAVAKQVHKQKGDTWLKNTVPNPRSLPEAQSRAQALKDEHKSITQQVKENELQNKAPEEEVDTEPAMQPQANVDAGVDTARLHSNQAPALDVVAVTAALQAQINAQLHAKDGETKAVMAEMQTTHANQMATLQASFEVKLAEMLQMVQGVAQHYQGLEAKVSANETTITGLQSVNQKLQTQLTTVTKAARQRGEEITALAIENVELQAKIDGLESDKGKLEGKVSELKSNAENQAKGIDVLNKKTQHLPITNNAPYSVRGGKQILLDANDTREADANQQSMDGAKQTALSNQVSILTDAVAVLVEKQKETQKEEQRNDKPDATKAISGNMFNRFVKTKSSVSLNKGKDA